MTRSPLSLCGIKNPQFCDVFRRASSGPGSLEPLNPAVFPSLPFRTTTRGIGVFGRFLLVGGRVAASHVVRVIPCIAQLVLASPDPANGNAGVLQRAVRKGLASLRSPAAEHGRKCPQFM